MPTLRLRNWCFTDWPTSEYPEPSFDQNKMKYLVYGTETCPTTGEIHFQGYVQLKRQTVFNTVKDLFSDKVHIEAAMGTPQQAADYCKKDGNFKEFGTMVAERQRSDLLGAKALLDAGATISKVADLYFGVYVRYSRSLVEYAQLKLPRNRTVVDKSYCTILWGDPGSGKSRTAYACDSYQVLQYNPRSGFWSAPWDGSKRIIIDDVSPSTFQPRELWLNILDPFAKQLSINIKGGYSKFAPTELVLTSNYDPATWMPDDAAFKRRLDEFCTVRHMVGFVDVAMRRFFEPGANPHDGGVVDLTASDESEPSSPVSWADTDGEQPDDDGASDYSRQVRFRACDRANASAGQYVAPKARKRCKYAEEAQEGEDDMSINSDEERLLLLASRDY